MAGYPYYLNGIGCDIIRNFGTEIKQLIASDPTRLACHLHL